MYVPYHVYVPHYMYGPDYMYVSDYLYIPDYKYVSAYMYVPGYMYVPDYMYVVDYFICSQSCVPPQTMSLTLLKSSFSKVSSGTPTLSTSTPPSHFYPHRPSLGTPTLEATDLHGCVTLKYAFACLSIFLYLSEISA